MEEDEYESLPEGSPVMIHMVAGACAGVLEHTVMYPVDCVKTRLQCQQPNPAAHYRGLTDGLYRLASTEGLAGSLRGIRVVVAGAAPAHAAYFAAYEFIKARLIRPEWTHANQLAYGVAGCCATMFHDAIMTPTDAIKQRLQMYQSPYSGCTNCARSMWTGSSASPGGLAPFYRAYTTQLTMNIPMQVTHFMVYEFVQTWLNPDHHYLPTSHMISGAVAGGAAAALTTPLDVCKTYLNTCSSVETSGSGLRSALVSVYRLNGLQGFFRGLGARVVFQMPGTAISWSVYEFFKYFLGASQRAPSEPPASSLPPLATDHRPRKVLDHPAASAVFKRPQV